jgi:hypothetical protein
VTGKAGEKMRTYRTGDYIDYNVTAQDKATGQSVAGTGRYSIIGDVVNPYGVTCKVYKEVGNLWPFVYEDRGLFYQDEDGSLYDCGKYDAAKGTYVFILETENTPKGLWLGMKSPPLVGDSLSGTMSYQDGSSRTCTQTIVGKEYLTFNILIGGFYQHWTLKETSTCTYSDTTIETQENWVYPSIYYVRRAARAKLLGYNVDVTYEITGYGLQP